MPSGHVSNLQHIAETVGSACTPGRSNGKRERGIWRPRQQHKSKKRPWTFPKAHGMVARVWSNPLMYGDMQNVSAQIIDNMYVSVKDAAARSNSQAGWELQAMTRNMRESELALKTWTPPPAPRVTDWVTDADLLASLQEVCAMGAVTISVGSSMTFAKSVGRAEVNATFTRGTGLRYQVWRVIQDFAKCSRHLEVPTTRKSERSVVNLQVKSFAVYNSEWTGLCPDLVHLPWFLAKYMGSRFHVSLPQTVPDPNGMSSHREIATLVKLVQVVPAQRNQFSGAQPGTISPFNVVAIQHPAVRPPPDVLHVCGSVLQCVAGLCRHSAPRCVAVCPSGVLQCAAESCSVLQCDAGCIIELVIVGNK